jgi:leucyl-tRNA synthetase
VTTDIEKRLHFNTAIAAVMELANAVQDAAGDEAVPSGALATAIREALETAVILLAPFVPHIANELWQGLGHADTLDHHPWPVADPEALLVDHVELVVQINGRVRGHVAVSAGSTDADVLAAVMESERVQAALAGRPVKRSIVVPGRVVNLVI